MQRLARGKAEAAGILLSAVLGLEYVKIDSDVRLERASAPFTPQALGMDLWQEAIEAQLRHADEAGADTFATLYHGCHRLICTFEGRHPITVEHFLSLFARALGIKHEGKYKKYRLWRDPERTLAEIAPCVLANNPLRTGLRGKDRQ